MRCRERHDNRAAETLPNVFGRAMASGSEKVIYSCKCLGSGEFTHYALRIYRPRSPRAQALIAAWRADPRFPRQIYTRDFLNFTLRHQRRATSHERQVAGGIWHSYMRWRHSLAKTIGVCCGTSDHSKVHMSTTSISKAPNVSRNQPSCADLELLRERMEALRLDPSEVRRIESDVFRGLAEACGGCECKAQCKEAPAVAPVADSKCANAIVLRALQALPWFKRQMPKLQCAPCPAACSSF